MVYYEVLLHELLWWNYFWVKGGNLDFKTDIFVFHIGCSSFAILKILVYACPVRGPLFTRSNCRFSPFVVVFKALQWSGMEVNSFVHCPNVHCSPFLFFFLYGYVRLLSGAYRTISVVVIVGFHVVVSDTSHLWTSWTLKSRNEYYCSPSLCL